MASDGIYNEVTYALSRNNKSIDLDYLKSLDKVVQGTNGFSVKRADVERLIQDSALAALPRDTAEILKKTSKGGCGGSLAIELVRRGLTELNVLARTLHSSAEEERREDVGLRRLYNTLSITTELHGALIKAGVDTEAKEWAKVLTAEITNLRQLRSTPWHQVALMLKLVIPESGELDGSVSEPNKNVSNGREMLPFVRRCTLQQQHRCGRCVEIMSGLSWRRCAWVCLGQGVPFYPSCTLTRLAARLSTSSR